MKKGIINKGWLRLHIVMSVVFSAMFIVSPEVHDHGWFHTLAFFVGTYVLYWVIIFVTIILIKIIRFLIKWIKEGFKED